MHRLGAALPPPPFVIASIALMCPLMVARWASMVLNSSPRARNNNGSNTIGTMAASSQKWYLANNATNGSDLAAAEILAMA